METLTFILQNLPAIGQRTLDHISIVGVAVGLAIITGVPIGIAITEQAGGGCGALCRRDDHDNPFHRTVRADDSRAVADR